MPQMAPLSWLLLFFFFIITFMVFNMINYFSYLYTPVNSSAKNFKVLNPLSWKW